MYGESKEGARVRAVPIRGKATVVVLPGVDLFPY